MKYFNNKPVVLNALTDIASLDGELSFEVLCNDEDASVELMVSGACVTSSSSSCTCSSTSTSCVVEF